MIVRRVIVPRVRIECGRGWWGRRRYGRLLVAVRRILEATRVSRVIAERYALEIIWRAANRSGLAKRNVVRRLAIEDEIGRLLCRKRLMAAEPYDKRTVHHLNWAVFCGSFDVFVDFAGSGRSNAPARRTFIVTRDDESPARDQAVPWSYFDRDAILHAFERVMNSPVVLGVAGFGRRTGPMGIGRMVVGVFWTLSQRVLRS